MSHASFKTYPLAYCTNVHAGAGFGEMFANLQAHAPSVLQRREHGAPMGLGLWFSEQTLRDAQQPENVAKLRKWLEDQSLIPFTVNAFPQSDFHQPVVKHEVYEPDWASPRRAEYTSGVFDLIHRLAPPEMELSVSTLPLGWPKPDLGDDEHDVFFAQSAKQLIAVCHKLESMEALTGRLAYLCLEPEPGCLLDTSDDVVRYFDEWLLTSVRQSEMVRRYLRICHDVCHAAVMFEDQSDVVERYLQAELEIGKVQISAALEISFSGNQQSAAEQKSALAAFAEPRYLHQTTVHSGDDATLYEDLPDAMFSGDVAPGTRWRTHFHVPVYLAEIGQLRTTNDQIESFLRAAAGPNAPRHLEVETYAWSVLPEKLRPADLAAGIAAEMSFVDRLVDQITGDSTD